MLHRPNNGYYMDCMTSRRGFTLIEMSIVLVIIGLIIGGVLVGRALIAAAELNKMVTQVGRYKAAVDMFQVKYECIPGDCSNATSYFGNASRGCVYPVAAQGYIASAGGTGTCNGDGSGKVGAVGSGPSNDLSEISLVFNQLSLAGLVDQQFDGADDGTNANAPGLLAGANIPATIRNGGIEMAYFGEGDTSALVYDNYFIVGSNNGGGSGGINETIYNAGLLTPSDAQAIDSKYDDGNPLTGQIYGGPWNGWGDPSDCMANPHIGGTYDLTKTGFICSLAFEHHLE